MAEAARARGYTYLAVTDHSASHGFGNHVTPERLAQRIDEVRELNSGMRGFRVLAGSEVNVMPDGSLDYEDDLLAELDWVMASVHTSFRISEKRMTERVIEALRNPHVDCIGHLTGRLIGKREPYAIGVEAVIEAALENGKFLEINGNPNRRDLNEGYARLAAQAGLPIVVNTDAHGVDTLSNMTYGVATARRAWLNKRDVANTRSWKELLKLRGRRG
jgi:DNA polymerase (family 10)